MSLLLCYICTKSIKSHWTLGVHLRAHRVEIEGPKYWSQPEQYSTSVKGESASANLLPKPQISGPSTRYCEELVAVHNDVSSHLDIHMQYHKSSQTKLTSNKFFQNNLVIIGTHGIIGLTLPSGSIETNFFPSNCLSPTSYLMPSGGAAAGLLKDSVQLGSHAVNFLGTGTCEANEHFMQGWQNKQHNYSAQCVRQSLAVGKQVRISSSEFNDCTAVGFLPQDPEQFGGQAEVIVIDLTCEATKRPFSNSNNDLEKADKMNPRKRYKKSPKPPEDKGREHPLVEKPSPRCAIFPVAKKGDEDLDLSLHL